VILGERASDDLGHGDIKMTGHGLIEIAGFYRIRGSFGSNRWGIAEERAYRPAIQRGGHDKEAQVWTEQPLSFQAEGQSYISLEASLVKFVKEHRRVIVQRRVLLEQPGQNPFRDDFYPCRRPDFSVQAHPVPNRLADGFMTCDRHAASSCTSGQPSRLQHEQSLALEPWRIEQRQWHARGLSRAGRRSQQRIAPICQGIAEYGQGIFYWELVHDIVGYYPVRL
jgi:hypothetical protein